MIRLFKFNWCVVHGHRIIHECPHTSAKMLWPEKVVGSFGLCIQPGGVWVGAHWSKHNRRLCVNLLPCVTLWFTAVGGKQP